MRSLGRGRAAILVDVEAVRIDADLDHIGAKLPQRLGRNLVGRAVGAIDHRPDAVEAEVLGQRALGELDIALARAVDAGRPADLLGRGEQLGHVAEHQLLDLELGVVGELVAVGPEQLDAVIGEGIVRGGDHHAEIGAERAGQHGDGRRRHRPEQEHVHADGGEAGDERGFDHIAGEPRILADHHAMAIGAVGEELAGGHADPQGHLRRHGRRNWRCHGFHPCQNICEPWADVPLVPQRRRPPFAIRSACHGIMLLLYSSTVHKV